jgi:hypothetical protein
MHPIFLAVVLLCATSHLASAAQCTAASAQGRVPLLELYTSEGCDSCPPTDRWISELRRRGYDGERVVVLAFHVDYWDKLGWTDRFGQRRFSERQRLVNSRNGAGFVYTPQLVLNGKDYRRGIRDDFAARVADISSAKANADIRLSVTPSEDKLALSGTWSSPVERNVQGWLALYENRLATDVSAGENRNKRLQHDFVVRDIAGPFPSGNFAYVFPLDARWKRPDLGVASFVQDARSGDVLQAVTLSVCPSRV